MKMTRTRGSIKTTTETVKEYIESLDCELLSEYIDKKSKLKIKCKCGNEFEKTFTTFRTTPRCIECTRKLPRKPVVKYTFEEVKECFKKANCTLLSKEYKNKKERLVYICSCGEESQITFESFLKGQRCRDCGYKNRKNPLKYTIEQVKEFLIENECILLSATYIDQQTPISFKCKCGELVEKPFHSILSSPKCSVCGQESRVENQRYKYEEVVEIFKNGGCELLEEDYKNVNTPLSYKCNCGNKSTIRLFSFLKGERCKACYPYRNTKYTKEFVKELVESNDCKYISQEREHSITRFDFICSCGNSGNTTIQAFLVGVRCVECGKKRHKEKMSGENNHWWNPNLTDEEREKDRKYYAYDQWRKQVFERDEYTCQCCNQSGKYLNAHHKDGYHWCIERRLDADNGVTLCEECHLDFHSLYGRHNNTESQFKEYIENYNNKERSA